jgi:hypothetical protein
MIFSENENNIERRRDVSSTFPEDIGGPPANIKACLRSMQAITQFLAVQARNFQKNSKIQKNIAESAFFLLKLKQA